MRIRDITVLDPQLTHRKALVNISEARDVVDREHYALHVEVPIGGENQSYSLVIRCYYDHGERYNEYHFGQYNMGDWDEIVSSDERNARYNAVLENEGEEVALRWNGPRVIRGIETDILQALIRRWEALCELVTPHVTF
jgi:hypothetical protein